jgi:hypothetical protein
VAVDRHAAGRTFLLLLVFVWSMGLDPLAQAVAPADEPPAGAPGTDATPPDSTNRRLADEARERVREQMDDLSRRLQQHLDGMPDRLAAQVNRRPAQAQGLSSRQAVTMLALSLAALLLYQLLFRRLVIRARARISRVDAADVLTRWSRRSGAGCVISFVLLAPIVLFGPPWYLRFDAAHLYLAIVVFVFGFGLCVLATVWLFRVHRLCTQRLDDLAAAALFARIVAGDIPEEPYVLYLRPFASTDAVKSFIRINYKTTITVELEDELSTAVRPIGRLVALGESLEHFGAGRIASSEAAWQDAAIRLIRHAALILVVPSTRPGTLWEIEYLLTNGHMNKTVFLDVPNIRVASSHFAQQAEWAGVGVLVAASGYQWPADNPEGALIFFGAATAPQLVEPLKLGQTLPLREAVDRIRALVERTAVP